VEESELGYTFGENWLTSQDGILIDTSGVATSAQKEMIEQAIGHNFHFN
jgi:hypothetical protein